MCHFVTSKSNFTVANQLAKSSKPNFASPLFNLRKFSQPTKHLLATRVPFHNFKIQFRSCESSCEPTCKMDQLAKSPPTCENTNRCLNFYLNLWFSHFSFRTTTPTCEKALQVVKPKNFRGSPPKEAHKLCVWRGPFRTPPRTLWNTSLSIAAMDKTRGTQVASSSAHNTKPRASPTRDSMSEASQASTIPPSEGGVPPSPPQRRYKMRRPLTTLEASNSRPKKSIHRPPTKKVRVSSLWESFAPPQPQPPTTESQIPSRMTSEGIIRWPMVTQPPIEGNLDCRARPFHSKLCFDIEAFRHQPELRDSFHLL